MEKPPVAGVILILTMTIALCISSGLVFGVVLQHGTQEMINVATAAIVLLVIAVGYSLRNALK